MMAAQNIDTLGPICTFSLRGVLTFVASSLDINGCVLSYFEGTAICRDNTSTSQVWHIKMLIRQHDYCTAVP